MGLDLVHEFVLEGGGEGGVELGLAVVEDAAGVSGVGGG